MLLPSEKINQIIIYAILAVAALLALFPLWNVLMISLSSAQAINTGKVYFLPVDYTIEPYAFLMRDSQFWTSFFIAVYRVLITVILSLAVTILASYPLSQSQKNFPARKIYMNIFIFTMLFNGGLIPTFLVIKYIGLWGSLWALILPGLISVYNIILMMNFFRQIPYELVESGMLDGANHFTILLKLVLPISKASIATICLFIAVGTWNEWFAAIIYLKDSALYPLQTYLRDRILESNFTVTNIGDLNTIINLSNKALQSAQIFISLIPILVIYPLLQKYFTKGVIIGSVKG